MFVILYQNIETYRSTGSRCTGSNKKVSLQYKGLCGVCVWPYLFDIYNELTVYLCPGERYKSYSGTLVCYIIVLNVYCQYYFSGMWLLKFHVLNFDSTLSCDIYTLLWLLLVFSNILVYVHLVLNTFTHLQHLWKSCCYNLCFIHFFHIYWSIIFHSLNTTENESLIILWKGSGHENSTSPIADKWLWLQDKWNIWNL